MKKTLCIALITSAFSLSEQAYSAGNLMLGKTCEPVELGQARLIFVDDTRIQAVSDFGRPQYSYSISRNTLIIKLFGAAEDKYRIQDDGHYLRQLSNRFPTDYICE